MLLFIRCFLWVIAVFHILSVVLIYNTNSWLWSTSMALIRELVRSVFFVIIIVFYSHKNHHKRFLEKFSTTIGLTIFLFSYSIIFSLLKWKWMFDIVIWIKYTLRYIAIFLMAIYIWSVIQTQQESEKKIKQFISWLTKLIIGIIIGGIIRQLLKHTIPSFFYYLWYGPVGDFVLWSAPPLYYRTWPWWMPRLSWIFAGPNNYWYFLVLYSSFVLYWIQKKAKKSKWLLYWLLYWFSALTTLSRWVLVWIISQCMTILYIARKKINYKIWYIFSFGITGALIILIIVSLYKWWSTIEHITKSMEWVKNIIQNPMWFWLWTAGPAIHYKWTLLPENYYLQLIADIGFFWAFIWLLLWIHIGSMIKQIIIKNNNKNIFIIGSMLLGLGWLAVEWLFLHVFEDSMVNYLFFIPFWIILWYEIRKNYEKELWKNSE